MVRSMSQTVLMKENDEFAGSGGVSQNNADEGFVPAFRDALTQVVYLSTFGNGVQAPVHILDGLPEELVRERDPRGKVIRVSKYVVSGFVCGGRFYTREEAARHCGQAA